MTAICAAAESPSELRNRPSRECLVASDVTVAIAVAGPRPLGDLPWADWTEIRPDRSQMEDGAAGDRVAGLGGTG